MMLSDRGVLALIDTRFPAARALMSDVDPSPPIAK
jgi:hypothetical protein